MNKTQQTLTARMNTLEAKVGDIDSKLDAIIAGISGRPLPTAKVAEVTVQTVQGEVVSSTTEAPAKKAKGKKTARKTVDRKPVVNGAVEGKRCLVQANRLLFIADHEWAKAGTSTRALAEAVMAGAPLTGNWTLGPRTVERLSGTKQAAQVVVAVTTPSEPAKADDRPRRANGTIAPKGEWTVRRALEAQGLTRVEVDKKTKKAMKALASV